MLHLRTLPGAGPTIWSPRWLSIDGLSNTVEQTTYFGPLVELSWRRLSFPVSLSNTETWSPLHTRITVPSNSRECPLGTATAFPAFAEDTGALA